MEGTPSWKTSVPSFAAKVSKRSHAPSVVRFRLGSAEGQDVRVRTSQARPCPRRLHRASVSADAQARIQSPLSPSTAEESQRGSDLMLWKSYGSKCIGNEVLEVPANSPVPTT